MQFEKPIRTIVGRTAIGEAVANLREALLAYDEQLVTREAEKVVESGGDVVEALNALSEAIREVGSRFEAGAVFLPELILAAEAMTAGAAVLTPALPKGTSSSRGTVVIGTVKGDIHDIGKTIVSSLLSAGGFKVVDIGIDVSPSKFAEAAERYDADIIGVSACLTTSTWGQKDVIAYLEAVGTRERYKIMVGGAGCSAAYAREIGADGYGEDASRAVETASRLIRGD